LKDDDGIVVECAVRPEPYRLRVDFSESQARLLDLARASDEFHVEMAHLDVGDYLIDAGVMITSSFKPQRLPKAVIVRWCCLRGLSRHACQMSIRMPSLERSCPWPSCGGGSGG
jgi:hypothetical protein